MPLLGAKASGSPILQVVLFSLTLSGCSAAVLKGVGERVASLAGEWRFELDPKNVGVAEQWFERDLGDTVKLPGSTDENRKGTPNRQKPDYSHLSRLYEYTGAAWYQRNVEIPSEWKGKRVTLFLERCHWETQAWLDDRPCGLQDSLCVPHVHDLGTNLQPGPHRLAIRVDNTIKFNVGGFAHSITEETQTNWSGIIGRIELRATPRVWIDNVQVYPNVERKTVRITAALGSTEKAPFSLKLEVSEADNGKAIAGTVKKSESSAGGRTLEAELSLGQNVKLWDEFSPALCDLTATLALKDTGSKDSDVFRTRFGMRDLRVRDKRLVLNGRRIFLRGTLECCIFPLTGYPPTDVASWMRVIRTAKSYGLNHLRFHSWCPPEAAFAAADRMGFLLHVELPQWVGNVGQEAPRDQFIEQELLRIVEAYGNHPSFGMLCMGNELGGDASFLQKLVMLGQERDPRHLYTAATAWSHGPNDDYDVVVFRGLHGPSTDADFRDSVANWRAPTVSHEVGQWTVFPNLDEMRKYTGVLRPRNFELIREGLKAKDLLDQAASFTEATGKFSAQLYKEEIEVLLRTPGHCGFQLLDLHDFPGQGTALIGVLDPFWDSKGVITAAEFRRFCCPTVPLLRMKKRTFTTDETFTAQAEVAHFGPHDLNNAEAEWKVVDEKGKAIAAGTLHVCNLLTGDLHQLGEVSFPLASVAAPRRLTVTVSLKGTEFANEWRIWVYPAEVNATPPAEVVITRSAQEAIAELKDKRKVLLLAPAGSLVHSLPGSFTPVFWSPVWFPGQGAGTMSILCNPKHPALASFPTDPHTDWQWYDLLQRSRTMNLDGTQADFRPIVQVIDNFTRNQKLGSLLEAKVSDGRLMVCSLNLWDDLGKRPAARQLLKSILDYMGSAAFRPTHQLTLEELNTIVCEGGSSALQSLGARVVMADSEDRENGNVASNAIDGDPDTIWHTQWQGAQPPFPHEIQIDMQKSVELAGFRYLPRQDMQNGWFTNYEFYVSEDREDWGAPATKGAFSADPEEKVVQLDRPCRGRFIRLVALSGYRNNPWAAIAELDVIARK